MATQIASLASQIINLLLGDFFTKYSAEESSKQFNSGVCTRLAIFLSLI
jgi:hypothetical protein